MGKRKEQQTWGHQLWNAATQIRETDAVAKGFCKQQMVFFSSKDSEKAGGGMPRKGGGVKARNHKRREINPLQYHNEVWGSNQQKT